jgi:hypothetical protein
MFQASFPIAIGSNGNMTAGEHGFFPPAGIDLIDVNFI